MSYESLTLSTGGYFHGRSHVAVHVHDGVELVYVIRGHCACKAGHVTAEGFAGDMLILPDGVPHNQRTYEPTDTAYLSIRGFQGILSDHPRSIEIADDRIIRWMDDLIASFEGRAAMSPACQSALTLALLQALGDLEAPEASFLPAIAAAMSHMRTYLSDASLSLDALAEAAGVSASHLSLLFRQQMHISPMRMLEQMRMERAKQMLTAPYDPVKKVARVCGYNDTSYFCRAFRKNEGISPGEFRHQYSGQPQNFAE